MPYDSVEVCLTSADSHELQNNTSDMNTDPSVEKIKEGFKMIYE